MERKKTILGIDPAWTEGNPSGVALIHGCGDRWECLALAPSYRSFLELASGKCVNWDLRQAGSRPDPSELISAAKSLSPANRVDIAAVDMPVSRIAITGRRAADDAISREFGRYWCSAHSPNPQRPGKLSTIFSEGFKSKGYPLATSDTTPGTLSTMIEVYPHPALLCLMDVERRVPYKVSRVRNYWRNATSEERGRHIRRELGAIRERLNQKIEGIDQYLPSIHNFPTTTSLKKFEDALDALISAWVGICYLTSSAVPFGDSNAAIWVPRKAFTE